MVRLLCLLVFVVGCQTFDPTPYPRSFSPSPEYTFYWKVEVDTINIALQVQTEGWIGFGLSEPSAGSMPGSDIMTVAVATGGASIELTERFADGFTYPLPDPACSTQNWAVVSYEEIGGITTVELARSLAVTDTAHDRSIINDGNPTKLIFAFGLVDTFTYHGSRRWAADVSLFQDADPLDAIRDLSTTMAFQIVGEDFLIPTNTLGFRGYMDICMAGNVDGHAIGFAGNIQAGNEEYVHHFLVYGCQTTNCEPAGEPCDMLWAAAGSGMAGFALPDDVSMDLRAYNSFMINMHYENTAGTPDVLDRSGVTLLYQQEPRLHGAGVLQLGDPDDGMIGQYLPTGESTYRFECPATCTDDFDSPVTIFADSLHTHSYGLAIATSHWRDGEFLGFLNKAEYYDWNHQFTLRIPNKITLMPGDRLDTVCTYKTTDANVKFGLGSEEEMCIEFVYYYPKKPLAACGLGFCGSLTDTQVGTGALHKSFKSTPECQPQQLEVPAGPNFSFPSCANDCPGTPNLATASRFDWCHSALAIDDTSCLAGCDSADLADITEFMGDCEESFSIEPAAWWTCLVPCGFSDPDQGLDICAWVRDQVVQDQWGDDGSASSCRQGCNPLVWEGAEAENWATECFGSPLVSEEEPKFETAFLSETAACPDGSEFPLTPSACARAAAMAGIQSPVFQQQDYGVGGYCSVSPDSTTVIFRHMSFGERDDDDDLAVCVPLPRDAPSYQWVGQDMNHHMATVYAASLVGPNGSPGQLLTITSQEDRIRVQRARPSQSAVWLACTDVEEEGVWDCGNAQIADSAWGEGEPDDGVSSGSSQDCAYVGWDDRWDDLECDSEWLGVLVEFRPTKAAVPVRPVSNAGTTVINFNFGCIFTSDPDCMKNHK